MSEENEDVPLNESSDVHDDETPAFEEPPLDEEQPTITNKQNKLNNFFIIVKLTKI